MPNELTPDKEKWEKLVKQIKDVNENFDEGTRKAVFDSLLNKKLGYFLTIFGSDDGNVDDDEYELLEWLMNDLYVSNSGDEYVKRIINMMH
ncbi:hypothetical protein L2E69_19470 [Planktothrix agardhii 1806]|jgi:hypothetical protein|uniref:hypothetical protein n=1 Tax=Planktothrix agardhii TaxID=1160 RepID=UPI000DBB5EC8|nr:hypothetical protein [Planktothrix agardhii]BBD53922.1 hypothetical protein NIES204_12060 [Planktothrix agardhii NIES-204]MCB8749363.1 hypothetical protein [Planktothrix agardhii 1810]MCB8758123.1 hypothetical protein [Planktothrix agardhii 1813]MCB8779765.1 hypothetical protein [Planktothrix agardhii 1031]MCF3572605.1 hypothetical protein [Planktothrix agardhii 1805]